MFLKICVILSIIVICACNNTSNTHKDLACGNYTCVYGQGVCVSNATDSICQCSEYFDTYPQDETLQCNYKKKKQIIAFLLESFITYGAGHYYCENYQFAVPKMFYWVLCYCLFIFLRMVLKTEENNTTGLIISLLACLFLTGMFAWQIADMVLYGINIYLDGNGIRLFPWRTPNNTEF